MCATEHRGLRSVCTENNNRTLHDQRLFKSLLKLRYWGGVLGLIARNVVIRASGLRSLVPLTFAAIAVVPEIPRS
jgi:hypothetical protein